MAQRLTLFPERTIQMAAATKKTAAIALAAGLALTGSAGIAAQDAVAQTRVSEPSTAPSAPAADLITSQVGETANLTIHKRVNPTELRNGTGAADENVKGQPLAGVGFSARKIDGDITNQETFNAIAKLANDRDIAAARNYGNGAGQPIDLGETGADGSLTRKGLDVGAYIIEETSVPESTTEAYVKADPFIVFLPMTSADGSKWNRDVHVYPKNSMAKITKAVVDDKVNTEVEGREGESTVTYTLDAAVPATPEKKTLTKFEINDSYNKEELRFDEGFVQSVKIKRDGAEDQTLTADDYTVSTGANSISKNGYNAGFTIALTEQGRGKVEVNDNVVAEVKGTLLNKQTVEGQDIWNSVKLTGEFTREPGSFTDTEDTPDTWDTPEDDVVTYVGNIQVFKTGEGNEPLSGATFDLYRCNDKQNVIQTGTSDANGLITFEGLHVTNFRNDADAPADEIFQYCVIETAAPAGYSKDPEEKKITLTREDRKARNAEGVYNQVAEANTATALRMNGVTVNNIKSSTPTLPATGGMGVLIVVLAGLAIIGGGVYAARRNAA